MGKTNISFVATINNISHQLIWFKCIHMISLVNQNIRFTIMSNELIIWAMNQTDTTMCQIRFFNTFFDEYKFDPSLITFGEEGLQTIKDNQGKIHRFYSFQINGRHLSILSRKPDTGIIKEFKLIINNTATCIETQMNRLQINISMESLVTKEYNPGFIPIKYDPIVIDLKYKKKFINVYGSQTKTHQSILDPRLLDYFELLKKELSSALFNDEINDMNMNNNTQTNDEINFISCDQWIFKNFIESASTAMEEIKLELSTRKMIMTAFTKGIYHIKSQDVLKQAVSMNNTISVTFLEHYCLFTIDTHQNENKKNHDKRIIFKLKDFKNFLSVNQAWKQTCPLNCWFCQPGDPILFEMDRQDVKVSLVQITDNENILRNDILDTTIPPPMKTLDKSEHNPTNKSDTRKPPLCNTRISPAKITKDLFVKDEYNSDDNKIDIHPNSNHHLKKEDQLYPSVMKASFNEPYSPKENNRMNTTIAWGEQEILHNNTYDQISILKNEKLKYLTEIKQQKRTYKDMNREENDDYTEMGPTQVNKIKGIFD